MHKHTLYQYRQMTFLLGEQMPKCSFITRGIISLSVVSVRLQIMFTSVFEAVWVAIQSRKYETCRKTPGCSGCPQPLASQLVMPTTWFPSIRPPPESPLHGPILGVTRSPAQIMSGFSHSQ